MAYSRRRERMVCQPTRAVNPARRASTDEDSE